MASTTVLVNAASDPAQLGPLIKDLDAQTLPYQDFDVVVVGGTGDDALRQRVELLSSRRPNVRFLPTSGSGAIDGSVLEQLSSQWLLHLTRGLLAASARLRPNAIRDLVTFAEGGDCDLVIARTELADAAMHDLFRADVPDATGTASTALLDPFLVLYRTDAIRKAGLPEDEAAAKRVLESVDRVGVFSGSLCLAGVKAPLAQPGPTISFEHATCSWQERALVIEVSARVANAPADPEARFSVRNAGTGESHFFAADASLVDGALRATARLDVSSAASGAALSAGVWTVGLTIQGGLGRWTRPATVPVAVQPAVVDGLLIACPDPAGALALDVGATKSGLIPAFDPSTASIQEGPSGTVLTVPLPDLHISTGSSAAGYVVLDKFPLRARLARNDAGTAELVCRLSGLVGTPVVTFRFGHAAATGLSLDISPLGIMTLARTPQPKPSQPAPKKPAGAPARPARPDALVQRVRHRLPKSVEPAVRAITRNETARHLYRRLAGLPAKR